MDRRDQQGNNRKDTVIMNSTCRDGTWEILDSGIIRNVLNQTKCIGNQGGIDPEKVDIVDCDSKEVES